MGKRVIYKTLNVLLYVLLLVIILIFASQQKAFIYEGF